MSAKIEPTEKEIRLLEFLRNLEFGSVTVDVQRGEPTVLRQIIKTIKL